MDSGENYEMDLVDRYTRSMDKNAALLDKTRS